MPETARAANAALIAAGVVCALSLVWPLGWTMLRNALAFRKARKTARDVAAMNLREMAWAVFGVVFPRRADGFSTGFLAFYYAGLAACVFAGEVGPFLGSRP